MQYGRSGDQPGRSGAGTEFFGRFYRRGNDFGVMC